MNPPFPRRRPAADAGRPRRIRWGRWTRWIHWIHRGRGLWGATRLAALSAPTTPSDPAVPPALPAPADVELDEALLAAIGERIATVAPERGGALLAGPDGVARLLLEDDCGTYSPASWDISPQLTGAVGELEEGGELVLCGTVHSHPAGMPDPSSTDVRTMTHTLELNPHLDRMIVLVLTKGAPRDGDLAVGAAHRLSVHVLDRRESGFEMRRARAVVRARAAGADPAAGASPVPGAGRACAVRVGEVLRAREARLLAEATAAARAQLRDEEQDPDGPSGEGDDALARVRGLVGSIEERAVLVAGAGSVGSRIAEDLVRSGVGRIVVIDPDAVSLPNMARSVYTRAQIGVPKVRALAERLCAINPRVEVVPMGARSTSTGRRRWRWGSTSSCWPPMPCSSRGVWRPRPTAGGSPRWRAPCSAGPPPARWSWWCRRRARPAGRAASAGTRRPTRPGPRPTTAWTAAS